MSADPTDVPPWLYRQHRAPRTALGSGVVPMPADSIVPRYGIQVSMPARPTLSIDGDTFDVEEVSLGGTWRVVVRVHEVAR